MFELSYIIYNLGGTLGAKCTFVLSRYTISVWPIRGQRVDDRRDTYAWGHGAAAPPALFPGLNCFSANCVEQISPIRIDIQNDDLTDNNVLLSSTTLTS